VYTYTERMRQRARMILDVPHFYIPI